MVLSLARTGCRVLIVLIVLTMRSDEIESALVDLLGGPPGPQGIVITLRRHDEYEQLILRIRALEADNQALQVQLRNMSMYPVMYLQALDELRECKRILSRLGLDYSFIVSLRPRY